MSRAAARPSVRLLAAVLHAVCVLVGPGLHLWSEDACGCGHAHAAVPEPGPRACGHGHCCHHHGPRSGAPDDSEEKPAPKPGHDPDECRVCQQLGHPRVAAPAVVLNLIVTEATFVARPLPPLRPPLVADAVSCRGPPASVAGV